MVQSRELPDNSRYFFGVEYSFGAQSKLSLASKSTSHTCNFSAGSQTTEQHNCAYSNWLKPVYGSNVEHLMMIRVAQRKTKVPGTEQPIISFDTHVGKTYVNEPSLLFTLYHSDKYKALYFKEFHEAICLENGHKEKPYCEYTYWRSITERSFNLFSEAYHNINIPRPSPSPSPNH